MMMMMMMMMMAVVVMMIALAMRRLQISQQHVVQQLVFAPLLGQ